MSTVFAAVRPLRQESSRVHRLRRLHLKRSHLGNSGQEIKHTLILRRRQLRNRPQTVYISPHHRRLDLRIQPNLPSMPQRPQPSGKRPAHTSKTIMRCGIRPIQTDRHARYPAFLEPVNRLRCQQRSRRRRHIRSQAKPHRIPNQLIKIRPFQRIPPLNTTSGLPKRRISSSSCKPSGVLSSARSRPALADTRQCAPARSHACVTSQTTNNGVVPNSICTPRMLSKTQFRGHLKSQSPPPKRFVKFPSG